MFSTGHVETLVQQLINILLPRTTRTQTGKASEAEFVRSMESYIRKLEEETQGCLNSSSREEGSANARTQFTRQKIAYSAD